MRALLISALAMTSLSACQPRPSNQRPPVGAIRTVFTDSLYHAEQCLPLNPGEDWRRVCTPKYQGHIPIPIPQERKP